MIGRIPVVPLDYNERSRAVKKELIVDYVNGKIFTVDDNGNLIDLTSKLAEYLAEHGIEVDINNIFLTIKNIGETTLNDIFNNYLTEIGRITAVSQVVGDVNIARFLPSNCGNISSSLLAAGYNEGLLKSVEKYNGAYWEIDPSTLSIARHSAAMVGTSSNALIMGGQKSDENNNTNIVVLAETELYSNGTWSAGPSIIGGPRRNFGACGNTSAALIFGGYTGTETLNRVDKYNNGIWEESGVMLYKASSNAGCGSIDAALAVGGQYVDQTPFLFYNNVSLYNGTEWAMASGLNIARRNIGCSGTVTTAIVSAGITDGAPFSSVEVYNGHAWQISTDVVVARYGLGGSGDGSSSLISTGSSDIISDYGPYIYHTISEKVTTNFGLDTKLDKLSRSEQGNIIVSDILGGIFDSKISLELLTDTITGGDEAFAPDIDTIALDIAPNTARYMGASSGESLPGLSFGGINSTYTTLDSTETYSGISWSNSANMASARSAFSGTGNINSTLAIGGNDTNCNTVERFDGSQWSNTNLLNTNRIASAATGSGKLAIVSGGEYDNMYYDTVERYNSVEWHMAPGNMNVARSYHGACGSGNETFVYGGNDGENYSLAIVSEYYNGYFWSVLNNISAARMGLAGCRISGKTFAFGGDASPDSSMLASFIVDKYNGIVWSTTINMINKRAYDSTFGGETALVFGGFADGTAVSSSEKLSSVSMRDYFTNDTEYAWFNTNDMNTSRSLSSGCGTTNAALCFGGRDAFFLGSLTEIFNGISWLNIGNESLTARCGLAGCGSANMALSFGGSDGNTPMNITEIFDGNTWSKTGDMSISRTDLSGCGNVNAALSYGGWNENDTSYSLVEKFNGDSWSNVDLQLTYPKYSAAGCGNVNAALSYGGWNDTYQILFDTATERFNGNSWEIIGYLLTSRACLSGTGNTSAALAFGGYYQSMLSTTELFNGTSWSVLNNMITARHSFAGCGNSRAALAFGGINISSTEIFRSSNLSVIEKILSNPSPYQDLSDDDVVIVI